MRSMRLAIEFDNANNELPVYHQFQHLMPW